MESEERIIVLEGELKYANLRLDELKGAIDEIRHKQDRQNELITILTELQKSQVAANTILASRNSELDRFITDPKEGFIVKLNTAEGQLGTLRWIAGAAFTAGAGAVAVEVFKHMFP